MIEFLKQITSIDIGALSGSGIKLIQAQFGTPGLIASTILGLSIAALVAHKLLKIVYDILRYVVIPTAVLTFVATFFLPYSFVDILPVTVAFFSLVLIFKS